MKKLITIYCNTGHLYLVSPRFDDDDRDPGYLFCFSNSTGGGGGGVVGSGGSGYLTSETWDATGQAQKNNGRPKQYLFIIGITLLLHLNVSVTFKNLWFNF